jgi:hypothetical protein
MFCIFTILTLASTVHASVLHSLYTVCTCSLDGPNVSLSLPLFLGLIRLALNLYGLNEIEWI